MYVQRVIIYNRAPVDNLDLMLEDKTINILTAINGRGKTTILSYIMDAFVELTRTAYSGSYKGKESSYYRVSSPLFVIDSSKPSLVYIRFVDGERNIDYLDVRGSLAQEEYNKLVPFEDRLSYSTIQQELEKSNSLKCCSNIDDKAIRSIFDNNITTFFPEYRCELPNYMNSVYAEEIQYDVNLKYTGFFNTPLEVRSNIHSIANWIMDVLLDRQLYKEEVTTPDGRVIDCTPESKLWANIRMVLQHALSGKYPGKIIRFGIGRRIDSGSRISIVESVMGGNDKQLCPTIFNLSSGELAILSMFCEIIKQGDTVFNNKSMADFHGIVLIDEVDKNLHIKLFKFRKFSLLVLICKYCIYGSSLPTC